MNCSKQLFLAFYSKTQISNKLPTKCLTTRTMSTVVKASESKENNQVKEQNEISGIRKSIIPDNFRFVYPEFLPDPKIEFRNPVREKLERMDMLNRRKHIDIPEFYVGSIVAVTSSDPHSAGKIARFVGICIDRDRCGLRARFVLRNIIDHQGVEVQYDMYDPTLQKVEVLRLEKRLDDKLYYLRDALPEYSTFDVKMEAEIFPEGEPVPVNPVKVKLRPRPWVQRWELKGLKGIANIRELITDKMERKAIKLETPWEEYDLMKQYRTVVPEEEQNSIYTEIAPQLNSLQQQRKKLIRKRAFVKPTKQG